MKDEKPKIKEDEMSILLRDDAVDAFNERWAKWERCDLTGMDFRGLNLRGIQNLHI